MAQDDLYFGMFRERKEKETENRNTHINIWCADILLRTFLFNVFSMTQRNINMEINQVMYTSIHIAYYMYIFIMLYMAYSESKLIAMIWNDDIFVWALFFRFGDFFFRCRRRHRHHHRCCSFFCCWLLEIIQSVVCMMRKTKENFQPIECVKCSLGTHINFLNFSTRILRPQIPIDCFVVPIREEKIRLGLKRWKHLAEKTFGI